MSYFVLLTGISRLFASHADSFNESFVADALVVTETIADSILSDFDKALVTANGCWLRSRFNLLVISFLNKVVSDSQSKSAFFSTERVPFENNIGMNCKKVCLFPIRVYAVALVSFDGSNVTVLWLSVAWWYSW